MPYSARYDRGDWKTVCDVCGREYKASQLKQRWDGLKTCSDDWEPRQPQDFVRGVADTQAPPWTRPEQANSFVPIEYIYDPDGITPILPVVVNSSASIAFGRFKTLLATVSSSASILKTTYPKPAVDKTVNGFVINTATLG